MVKALSKAKLIAVVLKLPLAEYLECSGIPLARERSVALLACVRYSTTVFTVIIIEYRTIGHDIIIQTLVFVLFLLLCYTTNGVYKIIFP